MTQATTLVSAWGRGRDALKLAGVEQPVLDARLLLEAAAEVRRVDIVTDPHRELTAEAVAAYEALIARRLAREPVSHILGRKGFWTIELAVSQAVLTPRPETELVVEAVLGRYPEHSVFTVLDLGTGSGAILLAILAARPLARGVGVDVSPEALAIARANADLLGLSDRAEFRHGSWGEGLEGAFDAIVSNPPYIRSHEIAGLAPEVAHYEPRLALDGGADGLDAYRELASDVARLLAPGGIAAVEQGAGQAEAVSAIFVAHGLRGGRLIKDLAGHGRVWTFSADDRRFGGEKTLGDAGA